jgi:hypothetical protein
MNNLQWKHSRDRDNRAAGSAAADVGVRLVALLTRQSVVSLKLDKDVQAYFSVKASIHIF